MRIHRAGGGSRVVDTGSPVLLKAKWRLASCRKTSGWLGSLKDFSERGNGAELELEAGQPSGCRGNGEVWTGQALTYGKPYMSC